MEGIANFILLLLSMSLPTPHSFRVLGGYLTCRVFGYGDTPPPAHSPYSRVLAKAQSWGHSRHNKRYGQFRVGVPPPPLHLTKQVHPWHPRTMLGATINLAAKICL